MSSNLCSSGSFDFLSRCRGRYRTVFFSFSFFCFYDLVSPSVASSSISFELGRPLASKRELQADIAGRHMRHDIAAIIRLERKTQCRLSKQASNRASKQASRQVGNATASREIRPDWLKLVIASAFSHSGRPSDRPSPATPTLIESRLLFQWRDPYRAIRSLSSGTRAVSTIFLSITPTWRVGCPQIKITPSLSAEFRLTPNQVIAKKKKDTHTHHDTWSRRIICMLS